MGRKSWTPVEEQQLVDWIGVYSSNIIAKKLKRTRYSVQKKMQNLGIYQEIYRSQKGVLPVDFANRMGVNVASVYYWIKKCNLPMVNLPKYMMIKNVQPNLTLIDDSRLKEWLKAGWAFNPNIMPTDKYYEEILQATRHELSVLWISKKNIIEICNLTDKVIQSWQYRLDFPRAVFSSTVFKCYMLEKCQVINWAVKNPKYITQNQIRDIQNA